MSGDQHRCVVSWAMGTYDGEVTVYVDPDDETDVVIAKAKRTQRQRFGPAPAGLYYESWKVVTREPA